METTTGVLLLLVSAVCASPYGYGVKGGAAAGAKAEARAIAGAFSGGVPVPVQPGGGFSGSYSKSAASSYAASSASSSASSYSFSGSLPAGFNHKDQGSGGCATGSCHQNNGDEAGSNYGSAPGSLSGANAGAFAGATAGFGDSPKINNNCGTTDCSKDNAAPCNGDECSNNIKKCASGQCNDSLDDGSNDISSIAPHKSESEINSTPGCSNADCGSTTPTDTDSPSKYPISQYASSAGTTASSVYSNPPTTNLDTLKEPCQSSDCSVSSNEPPSSYNVPINSVTLKPTKVCTNGKCGEHPNSPSSNSDYNQYSVPTCSTPNCSVKPPTNYIQPPFEDVNSDCGNSRACGTGKTSDYDIGPIAKKPSYTPYPENPSNTQTIPHSPVPSKYPQPAYTNLPEVQDKPSFVALNEPAISAYPTQPIPPRPQVPPPSYAFGSIKPVQPSYAPVSSHPNIPHSTSGYQGGSPACGPSGCPGSFYTKPNNVPIQPPCKTPGCNTQINLGPYQTTKQPPYAGGFGGPSGFLKPNDVTGPSNVPFNQKPVSGINPPGPVITGPVYGNTMPAGCTSGNCHTAPGYGGSVGNPVPCQSGNCNNNAGHFETGEGLVPMNHGPGNRGPVGIPSGSYIPGQGGINAGTSPCASGNCNQPPNNYGASPVSAKPGYGGVVGGPTQCASGNCNQPPYDYGASAASANPGYGGVVGGPTQCASGNCNQTPNSNGLATGPNYTPGYGNIGGNPSHCTSGNCNQAPSHNAAAASSSKPVYGSSIGSPSLCTSGTCNPTTNQNAPTTGLNSPGYGNAVNSPGYGNAVNSPGYGNAANSPALCTSGNCNQSPSYNGLAKEPITPGYGNIGKNPNLCASGNCNHNAAASGSHSPAQGGTIGNPATCTTGNCNQGSTQLGSTSGSTSSSSAEANAVAYTGGFGGPPGLLKPYDDGKLVGKDSTGKLVGSPGSSQYNAGLTSSANVGEASKHTGGYGSALNEATGINGHESGKSGCNSGCGSNGDGDSGAATSAKAFAGAVSTAGTKGHGGAFAGSSASAHASSGAQTKGGYSGR